MRKVLSVALLVMVLACSAHAGDQHASDAPAPATFGDVHSGDIHTVDIHNGAAATFVQVVLNLLALS